MNRKSRIEQARTLLRKEKYGVLCTISQTLNGWPFASLTPYAFTAFGELIILTSQLAEHTRNIYSDPRVSLFIPDSKALCDPQSNARLTVLGLVDILVASEVDEARRRYLARFPESELLFNMTDFALFKLSVERARFIGRFGDIYWLSSIDLLGTASETEP